MLRHHVESSMDLSNRGVISLYRRVEFSCGLHLFNSMLSSLSRKRSIHTQYVVASN